LGVEKGGGHQEKLIERRNDIQPKRIYDNTREIRDMVKLGNSLNFRKSKLGKGVLEKEKGSSGCHGEEKTGAIARNGTAAELGTKSGKGKSRTLRA